MEFDFTAENNPYKDYLSAYREQIMKIIQKTKNNKCSACGELCYDHEKICPFCGNYKFEKIIIEK